MEGELVQVTMFIARWQEGRRVIDSSLSSRWWRTSGVVEWAKELGIDGKAAVGMLLDQIPQDVADEMRQIMRRSNGMSMRAQVNGERVQVVYTEPGEIPSDRVLLQVDKDRRKKR